MDITEERDRVRKHQMGKWGATSYIIGNIVGSGIFITPTSILNNASSVGVSLIIWALSAVISALGAYCYVELGTSIRKSGADFAYLCYVKCEYIIQGLHIEFCDERALYISRKLIGFSLTWILLYLNFFSLRTAVSRFQIVATLAKILSAAIIIITGFYFLFIKGETQNLERPFENSTLEVGKLASAFFAGLFSYDGWDILNFGAEDIKNPKSSMSFAILFGISSVAVLYLAINLSYFVVLTVPQIQSSVAVATTFSKVSLGDFQYAIPFLVSILLIGSLNSTLFAASRYLYAASREKQLPAFISCINLENNSPRAALVFHATLAMIFSFLGNIEELINYVAFAQWMQRSFTMSALLYIRIWHMPVHPEAIRTPLIMPIIFLIVCLSLVTVTIAQNFKTSFVGLMMLSVGLVIYCLFIWDKTLKRFPIYIKWANKINEWLCILTQIVFNGVIKLDEDVTEKDAIFEGEIDDK
ncbi:amino acid permease domain-containing protein [Ditylenchus destructor]|nr:amino acid permease domain-containing protein [Ditylenchus destructor]